MDIESEYSESAARREVSMPTQPDSILSCRLIFGLGEGTPPTTPNLATVPPPTTRIDVSGVLPVLNQGYGVRQLARQNVVSDSSQHGEPLTLWSKSQRYGFLQ